MNTTTASTQPQAILETYGRDLRAFLRAVVVHAKRDPFLPPWLAALGLVQFEVHGSTLLAVACDGLSLGVARAEVEPAAPDVAFTVRVSALALEQLIPNLRCDEWDELEEEEKPIAVEFTPEGVTVEMPYLRETSIPADTRDLRFPDWRNLVMSNLGGAAEPVSTAYAGWNLQKFVDGLVEADPHEPLRVTQRGEGHPTVVVHSDWFLGLLMPVKVGKQTSAPHEEWSSLLAETDSRSKQEALA